MGRRLKPVARVWAFSERYFGGMSVYQMIVVLLVVGRGMFSRLKSKTRRERGRKQAMIMKRSSFGPRAAMWQIYAR